MVCRVNGPQCGLRCKVRVKEISEHTHRNGDEVASTEDIERLLADSVEHDRAKEREPSVRRQHKLLLSPNHLLPVPDAPANDTPCIALRPNL